MNWAFDRLFRRQVSGVSAARSAAITVLLRFILSFFLILYKLWDISPSTIIHQETPFQLHASFKMFKIFVTF